MTVVVGAPLAGVAVGLSAVPDKVFAAALVGPGVAIDPERGPTTVVSPITGTLAKLKPHAFIVTAASGQGVLVHLGIDTVGLNSGWFELLVEEGVTLTAGDPVVRWDPSLIDARGLSPICPVIALDAPLEAIDSIVLGPVTPGTPLFSWSEEKDV
jgi:PTS system N-acetylglucosamine-specific IIA component